MAARLAHADPAELEPDQLAVYRELTSGKRRAARNLFAITNETGALYGPFATLLVQPKLGMAVQRVGEELRFHSVLPHAVREFAILAVAAHVRSGYEWYAHAAVAASLGIPEPVLHALRSGNTPREISPQESAALQLARATLEGIDIDDAQYAEAKHALSEAGVMEVISLVGYYRLLEDLIRVFQPPLPDEARRAFD